MAAILHIHKKERKFDIFRKIDLEGTRLSEMSDKKDKYYMILCGT